jgi:hypothetical protein
MRRPAVPSAPQLRPLAWVLSSDPSHENSAQGSRHANRSELPSPATASLAGSRDAPRRNRAPQNRPTALRAQRRLATRSPAAGDPGARAAQDRHTRKAPRPLVRIPPRSPRPATSSSSESCRRPRCHRGFSTPCWGRRGQRMFSRMRETGRSCVAKRRGARNAVACLVRKGYSLSSIRADSQVRPRGSDCSSRQGCEYFAELRHSSHGVRLSRLLPSV